MTILTSPKLFNYLVIALFICAAIRWAISGNWSQVTYWCAAAVLNLAIIPKD